MDELIAEEREEAQIETATRLLEQGIMDEERVKDFFNFSDEQMERVREQISVLA